MFPLTNTEPYIKSTGERTTLGDILTKDDADINQLKNALTDLEDTSSTSTVVDYADIITIEDAINKPAKDVKVKVDAVQDLHGYTKPWVGGAGKQKIPLTVARIKATEQDASFVGDTLTVKGIIFTLITDAAGNLTKIHIEKTSSFAGTAFINLAEGVVLSGDYLASGGINANAFVRVGEGDSATGSGAQIAKPVGADVPFTADPTKYYAFAIGITNDFTGSADMYPMIRLASVSDATFEPYTNICPITGHSEAKVTRAGRNLAPVNATSQTTNGEVFTIDLNGTRYGGILDVTSGVLTVLYAYADLSTFTWTLGPSAGRWTTNDIQSLVKLPANNQTAVSGMISDSYENFSNDALIPATSGMAVSVYGEFRVKNGSTTTEPTGHIVYPLATPQTIQLTATEVYLLNGYNTLFGDTGDITLEYNPNNNLGGISGAIGDIAKKVSENMELTNAKLDTATLKSIVADSADFAAFKTAIAAL